MTITDPQASLGFMAKNNTRPTPTAPSCRPYFKRHRFADDVTAQGEHVAHCRATGSGPWSVPELCAAYSFPQKLVGGGSIAIVELGGGYTRADVEAYFKGIGQTPPSIIDVSVDGLVNTPGGEADGEVALDIQVAAASYFFATGKPASIRIYWCHDIANAVRAAAKDGCDVCSISWGADEAMWGKVAASDMEAAAKEALVAGMLVFAASGDNDSGDGGPSAANVDLPAGCPSVIGCGGTRKSRSDEVVWNNTPGNANGEGTGGGYSTLFDRPSWQQGAPMPPKSGLGRLVPDCAANADPDTGYEVFYGGRQQIVGGTSAVAPLYAGLFAALGTKLAKRHAFPAALWSNPSCFVDIVKGDNVVYTAQTGPDACTGLGVPNGSAIKSTFVPTIVMPEPAPPIAQPPTSIPPPAPKPTPPVAKPTPPPAPAPTPAPLPPAPPAPPPPVMARPTLEEVIAALTKRFEHVQLVITRHSALHHAVIAVTDLYASKAQAPGGSLASFFASPGETVTVTPSK